MPYLAPLGQPPRRALSALSVDDQATWHLHYCPQEGAEPRVLERDFIGVNQLGFPDAARV